MMRLKLTVTFIFIIFAGLVIAAKSNAPFYEFKGVKAKLPQNWEAKLGSMGQAITFIGPSREGRSPVWQVTPTAHKLKEFDHIHKKRWDDHLLQAKRVWLVDFDGELKKVNHYPIKKDLYSVSFDYDIFGRSFREYQYYKICKGKVLRITALSSFKYHKLDEKTYDQIHGGLSCNP